MNVKSFIQDLLPKYQLEGKFEWKRDDILSLAAASSLSFSTTKLDKWSKYLLHWSSNFIASLNARSKQGFMGS